MKPSRVYATTHFKHLNLFMDLNFYHYIKTVKMKFFPGRYRSGACRWIYMTADSPSVKRYNRKLKTEIEILG